MDQFTINFSFEVSLRYPLILRVGFMTKWQTLKLVECYKQIFHFARRSILGIRDKVKLRIPKAAYASTLFLPLSLRLQSYRKPVIYSSCVAFNLTCIAFTSWHYFNDGVFFARIFLQGTNVSVGLSIGTTNLDTTVRTTWTHALDSR